MAQLSTIRITEQPKINCPSHKFLSIFATNEQWNLVLPLLLVLESKSPHSLRSQGQLQQHDYLQRK